MHKISALLLLLLSLVIACGSDDGKPNTPSNSKRIDSTDKSGQSKPSESAAGSSGDMKPDETKAKSCAEDNGGCGDPEFRACKEHDDGVECSDADLCAEDNGGCGDAKFNSCKNDSGQAPSCSTIDPCAKDNGGCGDPKIRTCKNNPGQAPSCGDVDACTKDNGGCGDPQNATCTTSKDGAAACAKRIRAVAAGRRHACAIAGSELFCWGDNTAGQIGNGKTDREPVMQPQRVGKDKDTQWTDWTYVAAGGDTTCGLRKAGELYCWGDNEYGHVGDGSMEVSRNAPSRVGTESDWVTVAVGVTHACGIRKGGIMYCWGDNYMGQLGDGTTMDRLSPVRVGAETSYSQLTAGDATTCSIRNGELYCWGENAAAQIETEELITTPMPMPKRVGTAGEWSHASVSLMLACGVRVGELYCWGDNGRGQLGDGGTQDESNAPVRAGSDSDWVTVSVAARTACGTRKGGALYCWGDNTAGVLGLGTSDTMNRPTRVGSEGDWTQIAAGDDVICAARTIGVYCWGSNLRGQLGNGTLDGRDKPTAVKLP